MGTLMRGDAVGVGDGHSGLAVPIPVGGRRRRGLVAGCTVYTVESARVRRLSVLAAALGLLVRGRGIAHCICGRVG
jgi:hypothetical protein